MLKYNMNLFLFSHCLVNVFLLNSQSLFIVKLMFIELSATSNTTLILHDQISIIDKKGKSNNALDKNYREEQIPKFPNTDRQELYSML